MQRNENIIFAQLKNQKSSLNDIISLFHYQARIKWSYNSRGNLQALEICLFTDLTTRDVQSSDFS